MGIVCSSLQLDVVFCTTNLGLPQQTSTVLDLRGVFLKLYLVVPGGSDWQDFEKVKRV